MPLLAIFLLKLLQVYGNAKMVQLTWKLVSPSYKIFIYCSYFWRTYDGYLALADK